jgi:hypothetical protein
MESTLLLRFSIFVVRSSICLSTFPILAVSISGFGLPHGIAEVAVVVVVVS